MYVDYVTTRKKIYLFRDANEISLPEKLKNVFLLMLVFDYINETKLSCNMLRVESNH